MKKTRLEAFSDGVIAIIITIMVLELKVPHDTSLKAITELLPVFMSYVLSFIYIGIYWNNHHHLLQVVHRVNGRVLWANLHLLFWLSLTPFATGWMGENHLAPLPVALYGVVLLNSGIAYYILSRTLIAHHGKDSALATVIGKDYKGMISVVLYASAIALVLLTPWLSVALYIVVAIIWLIPDRRIECAIADGKLTLAE